MKLPRTTLGLICCAALALTSSTTAWSQEPSPPSSSAPGATTPPPAPLSPSAPTPTHPKIVSLRLLLADPEPGELERLEAYLSDVLGAEAGPSLVSDVSHRLDILGRYGAPLCRTERVTADTAVLSCTVRRARVLRRVRYESNDISVVDGVATGLPWAILESELRKRILLRPGEPIDDDDALGRGRIARQRLRIEDFLEREGYYGAQVIVDVGDVDEAGEVDVDIRIRGGSFVSVRRVNIASFGPFSQARLQNAFGSMCTSLEGAVDGIFLLNGSCFTKRRLQDTIDGFDEELRALGYPEGRVRVTPSFIDARAADGDDDCAWPREQIRDFTAQKLPIPPRCVDLNVEVVSGRNVVSRFHLTDGELAREWPAFDGTAQWLRETFAEPLSRTRQLTFDNPLATSADTVIVESELRARLTFNDAASVDETEARLSEENILEYMSSRGYPSPSAEVSYVQYEDGSVAVDYYLSAGQALPVRFVRLKGVSAKAPDEIIEEVELAAHPRGLSNPGFVTIRDLEDDVVRLRNWYAQEGYPEADVSVRASRTSADEIDVVFTVVEGERFVLADLIFEGGEPELTPSILKVLAHCRGAKKDPPPQQGSDCAGSPLLPAEFEADARRVEAIYAGNGYPDAAASVELGFSDKGTVVRVAVFPFDAEGDARTAPKTGNVRALKLGEIFVEGNLKTGREVLLREMGLDTAIRGSRLNPDLIAKGVARLRRTGLFSRVDAQLLGLDDHDDTAHLRVTVEERATATVDLSFGFSTQQLASLRLEARERNLLGTMFDGSVNIDAGLFIGRASQVKNQIRWPRMFGSDFTLSYTPISLVATDQPAGFILQAPSTGGGRKAKASWLQPDFRRRLVSVGTAVGVDWRAAGISPLIDDKLTIGVALEARADWLQVKGAYFEPFTPAAFESIDGMRTVFEGVDAVKPTSVFAVTPRLTYSSIDNPFDPSSGFATELFVRSVPLAQTPYAVVGAAGRGYFSFFKSRLTLATNVRARTGIIGNSGLCPSVRVDNVVFSDASCEWALMQNDLLLLGGERSVRGTKENQVGQQGLSLGQDLKVSRDEEGVPIFTSRQGLIGLGANVELRFTLIRQLFLGDLKPAVFADIAYSGDDFSPSTAENVFLDSRYAVSVGAGLRYVLPVGPLAIDVAYSPFDAEQNPYRVSLTLGYIF